MICLFQNVHMDCRETFFEFDFFLNKREFCGHNKNSSKTQQQLKLILSEETFGSNEWSSGSRCYHIVLLPLHPKRIKQNHLDITSKDGQVTNPTLKPAQIPRCHLHPPRCHLSKVWRPTSWKNPGKIKGFQGQIVGTPQKKNTQNPRKKHLKKKKHLGFCCWFFVDTFMSSPLRFFGCDFSEPLVVFRNFNCFPKKTWRHPFFRESLQRISCHRSRHKAPLQCQNPGQPPEELKQLVSLK